jgi:hypothetical protein
MLEILKTLRDTPIPIILVIGGLVFLLVPFIRRVSDKVEVETTNKGFAGFIGFVLLAIGIGLYIVPSQTATATPPTEIPPSAIPVIETPKIEPSLQVVQPSVIPPTVQVQNSSIFVASSPISINGKSYSVPTSNSPYCVASESTGYTSSNTDYNLIVPKGWIIVWDSWKAYWAGGSYENDGLLIVYGNLEGKVSIVNGEYCAVPVEWQDFAINLRGNAVARASRPHFSIGEVP